MDLVAQAEKNGNVEEMQRIAVSQNFHGLFPYLHNVRTAQQPLSDAHKEFSLWLLDQMAQDRSRDLDDYVVLIVGSTVESHDVDFFTRVVAHGAVINSSWPMIFACANQKFDMIDILFDTYSDTALSDLARFMLNSNLKTGVREHLDGHMARLQGNRISQHIDVVRPYNVKKI